MFSGLIESRRTRERSWRSSLVSLVSHAAVIGLAAYATIGATPPHGPPFRIDTTLIYVPPPIKAPSQRSVLVDRCDTRACFRLPVAPSIDVPTIEPPIGPLLPESAPPFGGSSTPPSGWQEGFFDPDFRTEVVERPAASLPGNPRPVYPEILRSARIEGVVSVAFVVDTAGRVEESSIDFGSDGEKLFERSVRRALLASRFTPAMTQGRRVRVLVRQDFAFRLTP